MTQKPELFSTELQELAQWAKVLAHPARLAIVQHLAQTPTCFSGDISEIIPLSRTTVSQHLGELKKAGLIDGTIDGLHVNYCLNPEGVKKIHSLLTSFFKDIEMNYSSCC